MISALFHTEDSHNFQLQYHSKIKSPLTWKTIMVVSSQMQRTKSKWHSMQVSYFIQSDLYISTTLYNPSILYKNNTYLVCNIIACWSPTRIGTSSMVMPLFMTHSTSLPWLNLPQVRLFYGYAPSISFFILDFTSHPVARNKFRLGTHPGSLTSFHNNSNFDTTN